MAITMQDEKRVTFHDDKCAVRASCYLSHRNGEYCMTWISMGSELTATDLRDLAGRMEELNSGGGK